MDNIEEVVESINAMYELEKNSNPKQQLIAKKAITKYKAILEIQI
jgi:hypothetical protein